MLCVSVSLAVACCHFSVLLSQNGLLSFPFSHYNLNILTFSAEHLNKLGVYESVKSVVFSWRKQVLANAGARHAEKLRKVGQKGCVSKPSKLPTQKAFGGVRGACVAMLECVCDDQKKCCPCRLLTGFKYSQMTSRRTKHVNTNLCIKALKSLSILLITDPCLIYLSLHYIQNLPDLLNRFLLLARCDCILKAWV